MGKSKKFPDPGWMKNLTVCWSKNGWKLLVIFFLPNAFCPQKFFNHAVVTFLKYKGKKLCLKFNNRINIFSTITPTAGNNDLTYQNQVVKAKMLWVSHVIDKNILFKLCNKTVDLFKKIFSDSPIGGVTWFYF